MKRCNKSPPKYPINLFRPAVHLIKVKYCKDTRYGKQSKASHSSSHTSACICWPRNVPGLKSNWISG
eukprot:1161497-Pelagomonas_calceolata.AAC.11